MSVTLIDDPNKNYSIQEDEKIILKEEQLHQKGQVFPIKKGGALLYPELHPVDEIANQILSR